MQSRTSGHRRNFAFHSMKAGVGRLGEAREMRRTRVTRRQAKNRASHRTAVPGRATDQASGGQFAVRTASSRVLSINACLQQLWNPVLVGSKVLAVKNAAVTKSLE